MLAQLRLNRLVFILTLVSGGAIADSATSKQDALAQYRKKGDVQGLYEIREVAKTFLADERAKNGSALTVLDPNLKIQVLRCAVPVTASCVPKKSGYSSANVSVTCRKTVRPQEQKNSDVLVPVRAGG
jgi:hypothetical protein